MHIPDEVYLLIIDHLCIAQQAVLLRASKRMYGLAVPFLYASLTFDLNADIHPLSGRFIKGSGHIAAIPDVHGYTKKLTILPHLTRNCTPYHSLSFPNLETLHIIPDTAAKRGFCHFSHRYGRHMVSPLCPLLAGLRPGKIIVGSDEQPFGGASNGFWADAGGIPASVKEAAVYTEAGSEKEFLKGMPDTVEKVTVILGPTMEAKWRMAENQLGMYAKSPMSTGYDA